MTDVDVAAALERTIAEGTARVEVAFEWHWPQTGPIRKRKRKGGLLRPLVKLAAARVRRVFSKWMESVQEPQQGWIDLRAWRVAVTGDPIPWMVADGEYRTGPPGSSVSGSVTTVQVWPPRAGDPLWLLDLLRGAETAVEETSEPVGGVTCTRFAVQADLCKADAQARFPMAVPNDVRLVRELAQLPLELWLDDEMRIRRVRSGFGNRLSVSFSDFGAEIPIDWTEMPPVELLDREA